MKDILKRYSTPFGALRTAEQNVQFSIDPSKGLTRERYHWYSNGTRFDNSHFSNGAGEIDVQTSATGTDTARLSSAFAGQYVAQALAKPGIKLFVDPSNVEIDENGYISLSHGEVHVGPFFTLNDDVNTGYGLKIDETGAYAVWISGGVHQGNSPVPQNEWNSDKLNGDGDSGITYDPSDGYILNFPYTWYNNGKLGLALLDSSEDELVPFHSFSPPDVGVGRASLRTPNLPVQLLLDNAGTAQQLTAAVGGMQFSLYGAESSSESRDTYFAENNVTIGTQANVPLNPMTQPGDPIISLKRDPEYDSVELRQASIDIKPDADIYLYVWDTWDQADLTGASFERPFSNFDTETRSLVDVSASSFDQTNAVFQKIIPVESGGGSKIELSNLDVEERLPLGAIRVVTAVGQSSSNISASYVAKNIEGF